MAESTQRGSSVYQYYGVNGALLYVGVTDRGIRRTHEHAESKEWWPLTTGCTIEHFSTREAALAREKHLIRTFRPPFNDQHNPERHLPREQRRQRIGPQGTPFAQLGPGDSLSRNERRRRWYSLNREQRKVEPCIECMQRPGHRGPTCLVCLQARPKYNRAQ